MKTISLLIGLTFFFCNASPAQTLIWQKELGLGNSRDDYGQDIATDSSGNVYTIGTITGVTDLDPGVGTYIVNAGVCATIFVSKLDRIGNFAWAKIYGCGSSNVALGDKIYSIAIDHAGNVVIAGSFQGTTDFDLGPGTFNLTANGDDIFVTKITSNGDFIWAKSIIGDSYSDYCYALEIDLFDNIVYSGTINGGYIDLDPGPSVFAPPGGTVGFFISKLNSNGDMVWANRSIAGNPKARSISIDISGNIICVGNFSSSVDFGPNTPTITAPISTRAVFVLKITGSGNFDFVKQLTGGTDGITENATGALDPSGNIIFTTSFYGSIDTDPGPGINIEMGNNSTVDICIIKLNNSGDFIFSKHISSTSPTFTTYAVTANISGDIFLTGVYSRTVDMDPGPEVFNLNPASSGSFFLLKLNCLGEFDWSIGFLDAYQNGRINALSVDLNNNIYLCGNSKTGYQNVFIRKLGASNIVTGTNYFDTNGDGIQQAGEQGMKNFVVKATSGSREYYSISNNRGHYRMLLDTGNYNITLPVSSVYFTQNPLSHTANFGSSLGNLDSLNNFSLHPLGQINDLNVTVSSITRSSPGFNTRYHISYTNKGTTILSGSVQLRHDGNLNLLSTIPAFTGYTNPLINWDFIDLEPFETREINITLALPASVPLETNFQSYATINPVSGDNSVLDNRDTLIQKVVGSYDPNEKIVIPEGDISLGFVSAGNYLDYMIRFQNTGTDTAFTVMLRDTLSDNIETGTFQMLSASHNYTLTMDGSNRLEWMFNNILLPDSNHNELLSHGFVRFRLKTKNNLNIGAKIFNKSAIYFDFNSSIVTNETTNTVVSQTVPLHLISFSGIPLGTTTQLNWQTVREKNTMRFDIEHSSNNVFQKIGSIKSRVNTDAVTDYQFIHLKPIRGINYYRLKMLDIDANFTYSKIIKIVFNGEMKNLIAYPNPAKDHVTIEHPSVNKSTRIYLLDINGSILLNVVVQKNVNKTMLNIKNFAASTYQILWTDENSKVIAKIIISK